MFKQLAKYYDLKYYGDTKMILGINTEGKTDATRAMAMHGLPPKHRKIVAETKVDPVDYLREHRPQLYNKTPLFAISKNIDDYNLLFKLYDDPDVYDWPYDKVQRLLSVPPDPVVTIMDEYWMDPHAVIFLLKDHPKYKLPMSSDQWLRGFKPQALRTVRDYFTSEDPWVLRTTPKEDTKGIFVILYQKNFINGKYVPTKSRKGHLKWRKCSHKHGILTDIEPSFAQMKTELEIPEAFPQCLDMGDTEVPPAGKNVLVVFFDKWDTRRLDDGHNVVEYSKVHKAIFSKDMHFTHIVFLTASRQFAYQLQLPHSVYPCTRLQAISKYIEVLISKRTKNDKPSLNFNLFCVN